jgi:6-phosphofructokinase 2
VAIVHTLTVNPAIDVSTTVARLEPEAKLRCATPQLDPGGGGINVARVIHRLGGDCVAFHAAGGHTGRLLGDLLDAEKLPRRAIEVAGHTREDVTVGERSSGRQYRFVMPGPGLSEAEWTRCLHEPLVGVPRPSFLVASGSLPEGVPSDFYARLARGARALGIRMILDTSGVALLAATEPVCLMKLNRREAADLCGRSVRDAAQLAGASARLVREGRAEAIVVSLGAEGALLATAAGVEWLAAPVVKVASRIGAGDSMVAGIVLGRVRGWSWPDSVLLGLAAGSATVMAQGTSLAQPGDVERLYAGLRGLRKEAALVPPGGPA